MNGPKAAGRLRLGIVLAGALVSACAHDEPAARSAVLVTLDTTRRDALGCNGGPPGVTPCLDRLARESTVFDRAYTVAPLTLPAHASMLTGLYPPRHGVRTNGRWALPGAARTLAEAAREAGVETAAFVSSVVLDPAWGLDQGFERYDAPPYRPDVVGGFYAERPAAETVARAVTWLRERDPRRPFLLWVHLWDPHAPWDPPEEFRGRTPTPYLDEVAALDAAVGELLDELRAESRLGRTTVLVVADHGEALGERGETSHGAYCYDTTLRVPLLLRRPGGAEGGRRSTAVVGVADVAPTLVDALGLPPLPGVDGRSLLREPGDDAGVYFESYYGYLNYGWSPVAGWVDGRGKYLHSTRPELYDPLVDPHEEHRLEELLPDEARRYRSLLAELQERPALEPESEVAGSSRLRDALHSIGYAGAAPPEGRLPLPLAATGFPSPAERFGESARVQEALALLNDRRFLEAEGLYAEILAENPGNREARENLAYCRLRLLRIDEALEGYGSLVAEGDAPPRALTYWGVCLRATGRTAEAEDAYARALAEDPHEVEALWQMADLLESEGREAEALSYRERLERLQRGEP